MKKHIFITLAIMGLCLGVNQNVLADMSTLSSGGTTLSGSAELKSIQNGAVYSDGTNCQVSVNSSVAGATVNWNTLNVPQNHTLNFYFPDANQYALNKVSTGITNIAGNVGYAAGSQAGNVIFANPNGINIAGTAHINLGSLLLTTHEVQMGQDMATLTKALGEGSTYHGITIQSGAQLNLANNLTIASLGIDIDGANITSGKNTVLVTSDGINYALVPQTTTITATDIAPTTAQVNAQNVKLPNITDENAQNNAIKIANTAFKTPSGSILIKATGTDNNVLITAESTMSGDTVGTEKGLFQGNVTINSDKNVTISSTSIDTTVPFYDDLTITAGKDVTIKNARTIYADENNATENINIQGNNITLSAFDTTVFQPAVNNNSILGNIIATATDTITLDQFLIAGNSNLTANNSISIAGTLLGANANKTTQLSSNIINVSDSPISAYCGYYPQISGNLTATGLNNTAAESVTFSNNDLFADFFAPKATVKAQSLTLNNFATNELDLNINSLTTKGYDTTLNATNLNTESDINTQLGKLQNANLIGTYNLTWFDTTPTTTTTDSATMNQISSYVASLDPGTEPAINAGSGAFNIRAFAADEETDDSDYKEEFLRRYVKEDKQGNLFTTNTFKAE